MGTTVSRCKLPSAPHAQICRDGEVETARLVKTTFGVQSTDRDSLLHQEFQLALYELQIICKQISVLVVRLMDFDRIFHSGLGCLALLSASA